MCVCIYVKTEINAKSEINVNKRGKIASKPQEIKQKNQTNTRAGHELSLNLWVLNSVIWCNINYLSLCILLISFIIFKRGRRLILYHIIIMHYFWHPSNLWDIKFRFYFVYLVKVLVALWSIDWFSLKTYQELMWFNHLWALKCRNHRTCEPDCLDFLLRSTAETITEMTVN